MAYLFTCMSDLIEWLEEHAGAFDSAYLHFEKHGSFFTLDCSEALEWNDGYDD